ncbi:MAG: HAMP domain-containing sensor histidine kinase, partial [Oscillospiraceae bacterium]|nr:HAMP domain-containing sensor histidine kinase [Oscillospiraceae bacterium]
MLEKLKNKFIIISMALVATVLLIVFAALIASTYETRRSLTMASLRMMIERRADEGEIKPHFGKDGAEAETAEFTETGGESTGSEAVQDESAGSQEGIPTEGDYKDEPNGGKFSNYSYSLIPTFCVVLDDSGEVVDCYTNNATVSESLISELMDIVLEDEHESGQLASYSLRWLKQETPEGIKIAFADTGHETESMGRLVVSSLIIGGLALVALYFISLFLAKLALKPVEVSWEQQKRFVADASHELKTPLTIILANTEILLSHKNDTVNEQVKWVKNTREEATRMRRLVDDLLWLAKSDAARISRNYGEVNLSELVENSVLQFESLAFDGNVELSAEVESGISLPADAGAVRQLLSILIENACKYAGRSGKASVNLKRRGETAELAVFNTGDTIPKEDLPHVFERFYRSDKSRVRDTGGFGLGLAIAKTIADNNG